MGIPSSMFTVILPLHVPLAGLHWNEMHDDGLKIARPRQLYTGYDKREFNSELSKNNI